MEIALPPKLVNTVYTAFNAYTAYTASTITLTRTEYDSLIGNQNGNIKSFI